MTRLYRRREDVLWRTTPRGLLIRPVGGVETFTVAAPGNAVWVLLAEPVASDELAEALADHYGESPERIRRDVEALLDELVSLGVVEIVG